jgi:hypothetical protein
MMRRRFAPAGSAAALAFALLACGNTHSPTSPTTPTTPTTPTPTPTLTRIVVTGQAPEIGGTQQFAATATMSDESTHDVSTEATWATSNDTVIAVSPKGVVAAVSRGEADVSATFQNVSGKMHVTIK